MTIQSKFRAACYGMEGLNSFATVIFFNYLYFYFRFQFGFTNKENLALAAGMGFVYMLMSWQAGRFAQRFGHFAALKTGYLIMIAGLAVGSQLHSAAGVIAAACVANAGMCFIWPTLEALVSEGDEPDHIPNAVGVYNITWAATNAAAFFIGGTLMEKLGHQIIFHLPLACVAVLLLAVFPLEKIYRRHVAPSLAGNAAARPVPVEERDPAARARALRFQRMGWLANPFAYIAINTLLAVLPSVAHKFNLSPMLAGFAWSLWCFARVAAFVVLWRWAGWHYRFRWLVTAFVLLILSFMAILTVPNLALVMLAQLFFGAAIGLIYYSSLFYSMDASDAKSEHGGIHEAAIGLGNCLGPGLGALSLQLFPNSANNGSVVVSLLLLGGLGGLLWLRPPRRR